jgi:hypothetical protein
MNPSSLRSITRPVYANGVCHLSIAWRALMVVNLQAVDEAIYNRPPQS